MDAASIARRRLGATRLTGTRFRSAEEAVAWHLAMQSQDYAPAKWSVGQRSRGLRDEDLDRALADGSIVRTHVLRPTWHFVARDDLRWLLAISGPRVLRAHAGRYAQLGLDGRSLARGERIVARALSEHGRLTRPQLGEALDRARFDRSGQRMAWLLMHCELRALIGSGGPAGKQQTYALLDGRVPEGPRLDRDEALVELVRRHLRSHGPASVKDLSWWSGMTMRDLRSALDLLGSEVRDDTVDGLTLWSLRRAAPARPAARVHLLQTYDELVVGFTESRFLGDPRVEGMREAWEARRFPSGLMLFDGRVAGYWRRTMETKALRVEVHAHEPRRRGFAAKIEAAAEELGAFFDRSVDITIEPI